MTTRAAIRLAAGTLGLLSGLFSAWHAYGALNIAAPMGTVGLLSFVAAMQIAVSVRFALGFSRKSDGVFLFLFGASSIADIDRFLWTSLPSLLATPAAFLAGLIVYYREFRKAGERVS